MAQTAQVTKEIAAAPQATSLQALIEKSVKELGKALPEHLRAERLVRIALTCVRTTPELGKCTPESFLGALFTSAQLGLEPIAGRAYILPFNNKRQVNGEWKTVKEAQFVVGYKGLADLFYRHEKAVDLAWGIVHENDQFDYEKGTNAFLRHRPASKNRGNPTFYWVMATLKSGGKLFEVMSHEDCMEHGRNHSKTYDKNKKEFYSSSPWATSPDSMCLKTVLIQLAKLLPLSVELQRAIQADESSREYREGIDDVLDMPSTTDWGKEAIDVPAEKKGPVISQQQAAMFSAECDRTKKTDSQVADYLTDRIGSPKIQDIPAEFYQEAMAWAGK